MEQQESTRPVSHHSWSSCRCDVHSSHKTWGQAVLDAGAFCAGDQQPACAQIQEMVFPGISPSLSASPTAVLWAGMTESNLTSDLLWQGYIKCYQIQFWQHFVSPKLLSGCAQLQSTCSQGRGFPAWHSTINHSDTASSMTSHPLCRTKSENQNFVNSGFSGHRTGQDYLWFPGEFCARVIRVQSWELLWAEPAGQ